MAKFLKFFDLILKTIKIILFPNHCLICENILNQNEVICEVCLNLFEEINFHSCKKCDLPLNAEVEFCQRCEKNKFYFERNISCFVYNNVIKKLIKQIKINYNTNSIYFFGKCLFETFKNKISNQKFDIITCVPIDENTLFKRGFNQSSLLAKAFFINLKKDKDLILLNDNIKFIPDLLVKGNSFKNQKDLNFKQRMNNDLKFCINERYKNFIKGKNILLIDDIATTCNTLNQASRQLKVFNCDKVVGLTIARVG